MKSKSTPIKKSELTLSVGRALKRAKKRAYEIARAQYATPIYIWRDGKVIAIKP